MSVIDGGPAPKPCSCGQYGRFAYGRQGTAMCHNPECPVIAYHVSAKHVLPPLPGEADPA